MQRQIVTSKDVFETMRDNAEAGLVIIHLDNDACVIDTEFFADIFQQGVLKKVSANASPGFIAAVIRGGVHNPSHKDHDLLGRLFYAGEAIACPLMEFVVMNQISYTSLLNEANIPEALKDEIAASA